ncbi:iron-containing alcohol dehydrogenase [Clostridium sp. SHJSY1]|uniref:1-propanol dehydrogenase PduQ n=1 Tax=Clostridium sp. SHJSY1 TaxID=2942483 RepID=UPI002876C395|nr:1-propanol dehydrogenase PduQ [Clostridium sp. SHJSY1]MDS0528246.1 iron-containing alcohol dehydrogenase [Clostridium sp. SHJSY1]
MKSINIKTKINFGENSLKRLGEIKNKRVWIICDNFLVKSGSVKNILSFIDDSNNVSIFDEVVPDPPLNNIVKGVKLIAKINPDVVIAYGGGSAIDTAKGIIYFARIKSSSYKVNFIAIPTTSGTGSEVTSATVITDTEEKIKHAIFDDNLLPDEAILDASLTLSVPKNITANTGIDVLTHAIEAYVSKNSNVYSDALAEKAVELVIEALLSCYNNGADLREREKMHEASNLAGISFNIAGLGVNHSLAHQIGGMFHIPHGLANGIFLTNVIDYNSQEPEILKKYAKLVYKSGMVEKKESAEFAVKVLKSYVISLMKVMNMPINLRECKVNKEEFDRVKSVMAENALKDNCTGTNPRIIDINALKRLLDLTY